MGISKCSQYCESGCGERIGIAQALPNGSPKFSWAESASVLPPAGGQSEWGNFSEHPQDQELSALTYDPPPPPEYGKEVEALLGTPMPTRPRAFWNQRDCTPPIPWRSPPSQSSHNTGRMNSISWARPGEPVNKVYVQFSNDLEGFLPYTLVISEASGLEFASLYSSADFSLDPLILMKVSRIDFDALMKDAFFTSLSRGICQRTAASSAEQAIWPPHPQEERVEPPYRSIVQLSVRQSQLDGCQVIIFIAVQSDPLAEELVQSCHKLKKRRAMKVPSSDPLRDEISSRSVSRGCPTPRTAVSAAANATPLRTPTTVTREGFGATSGTNHKQRA